MWKLCLVLLVLFSRSYAEEDASPEHAAYAFFTAKTLTEVLPVIPSSQREELKQYDPDLLSDLQKTLPLVSGLNLNIPVSVEENPRPGVLLRLSNGTALNLEFLLARKEMSAGEATLDFDIRLLQEGKEIADSPIARHWTMKMVQENGVWLVTRNIVTAPFDLYSAAVLANLQRARDARQEARSVGTIRWLNKAELDFTDRSKQGSFACDLATLKDSAKSLPQNAQELIATVLANGVDEGYRYRLDCKKESSGYTLYAEPLNKRKRSFCSTEQGIISAHPSGSGKTCLEAGQAL